MPSHGQPLTPEDDWQRPPGKRQLQALQSENDGTDHEVTGCELGYKKPKRCQFHGNDKAVFEEVLHQLKATVAVGAFGCKSTSPLELEPVWAEGYIISTWETVRNQHLDDDPQLKISNIINQTMMTMASNA